MFYYYDAKRVTRQQKDAALVYLANLKSKGAVFVADEEGAFYQGFLAGYLAADDAKGAEANDGE